MTIRILKEPDVFVTQAELERLVPLYRSSQKYTVEPVSFDTWLRQFGISSDGAKRITICSNHITNRTLP